MLESQCGAYTESTVHSRLSGKLDRRRIPLRVNIMFPYISWCLKTLAGNSEGRAVHSTLGNSTVGKASFNYHLGFTASEMFENLCGAWEQVPLTHPSLSGHTVGETIFRLPCDFPRLEAFETPRGTTLKLPTCTLRCATPVGRNHLSTNISLYSVKKGFGNPCRAYTERVNTLHSKRRCEETAGSQLN